MSHYVKVTTKYRDAAALKAALAEQFPDAQVHEYEKPLSLSGYMGKKGKQCHIIVSKVDAANKRGPAYGEMGFCREKDGTYSVHMDAYDEARAAGLAQKYATTVAVNQAKRQGYTVAKVANPNGTVTLTLSKWS